VTATATAGWTVQAYRFALDPAPAQARALASHAGAARRAFNVMLAAVKANLDQRAAERSYGLDGDALTPSLNWSAYGLRREWNIRKHTVAPWWRENSKEAYAAGCANLGAALGNWSASKKGSRKGPRAGFPRFKAKHRDTPSVTFTTGAIRVEPDRRHVRLPVIGTVKTHESTRKLARRMEAGTARITTATIRFERGRWFVSFVAHVQRAAGRPAHVPAEAPVIGVDLGVRDLIVAATLDGAEIARRPAPPQLRRAQRRVRALQRKAARQHGPYDPAAKSWREPSHGWVKTQQLIRREHTRIANLRTDHLHKTTTRLAQRHQVIGVETLAPGNMARRGGRRKRGLNRALANASLGTLTRLLGYKAGWYGCRLVAADRFFPSSKTCSRCGAVKTKLPLSERTFACGQCGLVLDRDRNAAINLARHALAATTGGSGPLVTGGADGKTRHRPGGQPPGPDPARGVETGTRAGDAPCAAGGTATPKGAAA